MLRSRTEVFDNAREVRERLRFAAEHDLAAMDAVDVGRLLPASFQHRSAWMMTAEQLVVLAEATSELDGTHRMHRAVE